MKVESTVEQTVEATMEAEEEAVRHMWRPDAPSRRSSCWRTLQSSPLQSWFAIHSHRIWSPHTACI